MRVLAVTSLFPNAARPLVAPFNRQQLAALGRLCEVHTFAPILTFPGAKLLGNRISGVDASTVPLSDTIDNLRVRHPRALYTPGLQGFVGVPLYAASLMRHVLPFRGKVDVVFAAWAHPDGCAAPLIAKVLGVPCVVKVQGSDIDLYGDLFPHKYWLRAMLPRVDRVVAVSRALARDVGELGVPLDRTRVVYNGVDPTLFHVRDRAVAREQLGIPLDARLILYVGNVLQDKGARELVAAFKSVRERDPLAHLAVVGKGPLVHLFESMGDRVIVPGPRPLPEIPVWMAASDVVTLPSYHEGTPNVVIEALNCGRRVVATNVGGIPDLITEPALGTLVPVKDERALGQALSEALSVTYDPSSVATKGGRGDWEQSARHLLEVLREVC
jgi:glycosyltransferase involved in cell wall biosynthesis